MPQAEVPTAEPRLHPVIFLVEWLAKVWAPLAAYTFALATAYWFEFRHVYAIPISFASASTIAALPALAGIILGAFAVTVGLALLPSAALWFKSGTHGKRLIDVHEPDPATRGFSNPYTSRNLGRQWLTVNLTFAVCVTLAMVGLPAMGGRASVVQMIGTSVPMLVGVSLLQGARRRAGIKGWHAVWFNGFLAWIMLAQWLLVTFGIVLALDVIQGQSFFVGLSIAVDAASLAMGVFAAQFVFALGARVRWRGMSARGVLLGVLALSALPLAVPKLGARLAAIPLAANGPDGKKCVVLLASDKASSSAWQDISADPGKPPVHSRQLAFATLLDSYFVKVKLEDATETVPVEQVRRIEHCPAPVLHRP